jgi:hypothetical protein
MRLLTMGDGVEGPLGVEDNIQPDAMMYTGDPNSNGKNTVAFNSVHA